MRHTPKSLNIFYILLCIIGLTACTAKEHDKSSQNSNHDLKQVLYNLTNNIEKTPTEISGLQMILIKNGDIIFEHAEGLARRTSSAEIPLTTDHKVRIASISKFVLTLAFMTLVEEEKVELDGDISSYLGFTLRNPNFPDRKITARQLLSHTSSIRDGSYYFLGLDQNYKDFFHPGNGQRSAEHFENGAHFASAENQGPGDYFTYSNLNFGILSGIIEMISGERMDIFVKNRLLAPLGIDATFNVCTLYEDNFSKLATLYRRGDGGETWNPDGPWIEQVDGDPIGCYYESEKFSRDVKPDLSPLKLYDLGKNPTLFSPQGGLRASSRDLAVIMQMLLNRGTHNGIQIISESSIREMMKPVWTYDTNLKNGHTGGESALGDPKAAGMMTTYGLSTHVIDLQDWGLSKTSKKLYGHLGSAYGLQGQFWFNPDTKDGIITFITGVGDNPSNATASIPLYAIEETLLRHGLQGINEHQ